MKLEELMATARDAITVKRVFGEPYESNGVTVIAAATVGGGVGGGSGHDKSGDEGEGGGFGMSARPAGVYVIANGDVQWRPAVDINRIVQTTGVVVVVFLLTHAMGRRARRRAAAKRRH